MLHQRDVRCEELTLELMQLLEERDTLQLRLSNAIRVNEDLRKYATSTGSSPKKDFSSSVQPLVEDPSPSTSEGPVEIAKEAIDSPNVENGKALAQKYVFQQILIFAAAVSCLFLSLSLSIVVVL